jgi:opacity protein-like surface antigen
MKCRIALASLLAMGLGGVAFAAQHSQPEEEPAQQAHGQLGEQGEVEGHGGEHHHKNHVAFFLGSTEAEEHHGEQGDRDFTIGVDYERRLSRVLGVGGLLDWVVEGRREFLLGVPVFLHAGKHAKFQLAPCYQRIRETSDDEFVFRTGFMWDFYVGSLSLAPTVFYDFTDGQDFLVVGLSIGTGF